MILNFEKKNVFIPYYQFMMDTFEKALTLIIPGVYLASCNLRHVYYTVPIAENHDNNLHCEWNDTLYQYTCFQMALHGVLSYLLSC